jgi:hypothetical protein
MAVPGQRSLEATRQYADAARRAAHTSGAQVVDLHEAFVAIGNWSDLLHDGLHFASGASRIFFQLLSKHLNNPAPTGPALSSLPFALPYWASQT